ncbi:MAG: hypothetical protein K2L17_08370 [Muribaculaceae bacterium]|nr:hypothetical protein [Muribaculaceae bacterium]
MNLSLQAQNAIEYEGYSFPLSETTVVLDQEGLLDCPGSFSDPLAAFQMINRIGRSATLLVAPSVYWLDNPDDPEVRSDKGGTPYAVRIKCDSLTIIGLSKDPEDIVFAVNRGQTQGAVGNFTMFHFSGNSLETKNITFGNYCNVDLIYKRNSKLNRTRRKDAIVQAQIGICENTDRLFAENCRFISRLNLCPFVGARRSLYDNCYFECTDDALSGSAIYLDCRFTFFSSKPFYSTAETGAVFLNCDITCLGTGTQYFTKVPGQVTAIDTRFHSEHPIDIRWTRDASDIICRQENITLNGKSYIIDSDRPDLGPTLDKSPLRNAYFVDYNGQRIYNLPNLLKGDDGWDPKGYNAIISEIESKTGSNLTNIPVALRLKSDVSSPLSDGDKVVITSYPLRWGGYPAGQSTSLSCVAENKLPEERNLIVPISTPDGITAKLTFNLLPNLKDAPKFKRKPAIRFDNRSRQFEVDYTLSGKGEDESTIMWGRLINDGNSPQLLITSDSKAPQGKHYTAKAGDFAYGLVAIVFPKYKDSKFGAWEQSPIIMVSDPDQVESLPESNLRTDFHDIFIRRSEHGIPGIWCFDVFKPSDTSHVDWQPSDGTGWYYGKGYDASKSVGMVQNEKGARMSYLPARDACHNMSATLVVEPAKSGGQGFGSATSQYMDICVKFDPITLNGYALRIERTPDHDKAVSFSLIKYKDGKTSRISDEVISNCYRTPCHISIGIENGILHASASTEAENTTKCCNLVVDNVQLSMPVEDTTLTGFCIQHTGSTGPSSTLIKSVNLNWE